MKYYYAHKKRAFNYTIRCYFYVRFWDFHYNKRNVTIFSANMLMLLYMLPVEHHLNKESILFSVQKNCWLFWEEKILLFL